MKISKAENIVAALAMFALIIIVLMTMVFRVFAATIGSGQTTNGEFSWEWTADNKNDSAAGTGSGSISGPDDNGVYTFVYTISATSSATTNKGCDDEVTAASTTVTATITNNTGSAILINSKTTSTANIGGIPSTNMLANGAKFTIQIIAKPNGDDAATAQDTVTITYTTVDMLNVKFYGADNVQYAYDNVTLSNSLASYATELSIGSSIVLPTPTITNGTFYGWRMGDSSLHAAGSTVTIGADTSFYPVVLNGNEQKVFEVDGNTYYFWEDAACAAVSGTSKKIVLIGNHTLPNTFYENGVSPEGGMYITGANGNVTYEIPNGCTFLLPYASTDTTVATSTYTDDSGSCNSTYKYANAKFITDYSDDSGTDNSSIAGVMDPSDPYLLLTVPSGTTLNVTSGSKLVIGGTIVGGTTNTRGVCGGTVGDHSNIQLDGTIDIADSGILSCCGYILGEGKINVASGGEVYQPFVIMDHRDGHFAANSTGDNTFPLTRYTMNNIQCQLDIVYGGLMYGYINVFTQPNSTANTNARHNVDCQLIIGTTSDSVCLIKLSSDSSTTLTYDASAYVECANNNAVGYYSKVGRTTMRITGGASLGGFQISVYVPILGNQTSDSTKMVFPVPYNYNISLENGSYSLDNSLMLLPGATMTVTEDATLTAASGTFIVFDGLRDYAHYGSTVAVGTWYVYHYPSTSDLQSKGTLKSNGTANFIVNGTLIVNSGVSFGGYVQTTSTTGKIVMNGTPSATTGIGHIGDLGGLYGYAVNDQAGRTTRTLAAKLYKANGQTLTMESGKTYIAIGTATNTIANYTYNVYTDSSSTSAYSTQTETLGANVVGNWCISGNHTYAQVVTNPTCTAQGYITHTCSVCGDSYVDTYTAIDKSNHTNVITDAAVEPSCDQTGLTEGSHCSVCGEVIVAQTEVPSTGHNHEAVVTDPTCTEDGYTTYTCHCGDNYIGDEVAALGHSYDDGVVTVDPTCTGKGVKTYTCALCGDTYTEEVAALGHVDKTGTPSVEVGGDETGDSICDRCDLILFHATNVNLGNNLDMLFAFSKTAADSKGAYYVVFTRDGVKSEPVHLSSWRVQGISNGESVSGDAFYVVTYGGFAAKEMCEYVTVTIYDKNDNVISVSKTDSIRDYAHRILETTDIESLKTLIADMLNYGAACQVQLGYNTDNLANNCLDKSLIQTYEQISTGTLTVDPNAEIDIAARNLIVESHISLHVAFNGDLSSYENAYVFFTGHKGNEVGYATDLLDGKYIIITNLVVADYQSEITITLGNNKMTTTIQDYLDTLGADDVNDVFDAFAKFAASAHTYLHRNDTTEGTDETVS